jgi:hypothetical protein
VRRKRGGDTVCETVVVRCLHMLVFSVPYYAAANIRPETVTDKNAL